MTASFLRVSVGTDDEMLSVNETSSYGARIGTATLKRKTAETDIALTLAIDGRGKAAVDTGVPFFDHMLTLFAKHAVV